MFIWLTRTLIGSRRCALLTVVGLIALTAILSVIAPKTTDVEDNEGTLDPPASAESVQAQALLAQAFPGRHGLPAIIVLRDPQGLTDTDFDRVQKITEALSGPGPVVVWLKVDARPDQPVQQAAVHRRQQRRAGRLPRWLRQRPFRP